MTGTFDIIYEFRAFRLTHYTIMRWVSSDLKKANGKSFEQNQVLWGQVNITRNLVICITHLFYKMLRCLN